MGWPSHPGAIGLPVELEVRSVWATPFDSRGTDRLLPEPEQSPGPIGRIVPVIRGWVR